MSKTMAEAKQDLEMAFKSQETLIGDLPEIDYESTENRVILRGKYMGEDILIYYYGESGHPCAYLKIKGDENSVYYANDEPCHGGITFSNYVDEGSKRAEGRFDKGFWIGWDYAHGGDYMRILGRESDKKRTTKEILKEIEEMIMYCKTKGML